jgi:hypothetical protein
VVGGTVSGIIAHEPIEDILHHAPSFEIHEYLGLSLTPLFLALGIVRFLIDKKTRLQKRFHRSFGAFGDPAFLSGKFGRENSI